MSFFHSNEEVAKMPTEQGYCKFLKIDDKWHVKGPSKSFEGQGPFHVHKMNGQVLIEKERLKFVKRYVAKHNKRSNQLSHYCCKYDLYEVINV